MSSKTRINTIVFDLDGTLLDTLDDLADAVNFSLNKNNMPPRTIDEVRRFVGNGIANLIVRAMPGGNADDTLAGLASDDPRHQSYEQVFNDFKAYYGEHCEDKTKPYDGIIEMLNECKKRGYKTAVVSNKADFAVKKLCPAYFGELIAVASGEDETHGIGKKPAPEMVFKALSALGSSADEAVYVGDSDVDIATAKNSGLPCISVLWGFRSREFLLAAGAERLVEVPGEILALIENM